MGRCHDARVRASPTRPFVSAPGLLRGWSPLRLVGDLVAWPLPHSWVHLALETVGAHSQPRRPRLAAGLSARASVPSGNPQAHPGPAAPVPEGTLPRRQGRRHPGPAILLEAQPRVTGVTEPPRLPEEQMLRAAASCQPRGWPAAEDRGRRASSISHPGPQFGERRGRSRPDPVRAPGPASRVPPEPHPEADVATQCGK